MKRLPALALLIAMPLAACGGAQDDMSAYDGEEVAGESYDEFDARRDSYDGDRGSFAGSGCTQDCSGHEAGYAWAEERGITDPDDCGGRSWSFIEGCRAYAEEQ